MKKVIIYDTLYGFTKSCSEFVYDNMYVVDMYEIDSDLYNINGYSEILLGTYVYKGAVSEKTQKFLKTNKSKLLDKKLKIFCSALDKSDFNNALQTSIDPDIFYHAKIVNSGGKITLNKLSFFERRLIKKRINITNDVDEFYPERLLDLINL